jgi:thioredoxin reductase (NADPH)
VSDKITYIDTAAFEREVLSSQTPVVVDFYSTECPPCEALAAKFEALAAVYGDDIKFVKVFRQENRELAQKLGVRSSPTLIFYKGGERVGDMLVGGIKRAAIEKNLQALVKPERATEIAELVKPVETQCDVLIVGAGPAGLTAGIYAAQAKLDTIVLDRALAGGNLAITHRVSNFPGFIEPQPGYQLAHAMSEQAKVAGVKFRQAVDLTTVNLDAKTVSIDGVETIRAKKLVLATGSSPRSIGVKGEAEYRGHGVSYCATCDAKYYEGKHVVVIGGGNTAIGESLFIAKFASKLTVVHQFDKLQANREFQEQAFKNPKIEFVFSHEPREFLAENGSVNGVVVEDLKTHQRRTIACDGVFVFAGMQPNLDGMAKSLELDNFGYVKVDPEMRTNVPDVFAAGDVRSKQYRQMTTAVSDGTIAAMVIAKELGA